MGVLDIIRLELQPNPTAESTVAVFSFSKAYTERYIELQDITGRVLRRTRIDISAGSLEIDMQQYGAGLYIVRMVGDGKVLKQQKLSLTR